VSKAQELAQNRQHKFWMITTHTTWVNTMVYQTNEVPTEILKGDVVEITEVFMSDKGTPLVKGMLAIVLGNEINMMISNADKSYYIQVTQYSGLVDNWPMYRNQIQLYCREIQDVTQVGLGDVCVSCPKQLQCLSAQANKNFA